MRVLPHSYRSLRISSSESIARTSYYSRRRSVFFNFPRASSHQVIDDRGKYPRRDGPEGKPNRVMNIPRILPADFSRSPLVFTSRFVFTTLRNERVVGEVNNDPAAREERSTTLEVVGVFVPRCLIARYVRVFTYVSVRQKYKTERLCFPLFAYCQQVFASFNSPSLGMFVRPSATS